MSMDRRHFLETLLAAVTLPFAASNAQNIRAFSNETCARVLGVIHRSEIGADVGEIITETHLQPAQVGKAIHELCANGAIQEVPDALSRDILPKYQVRG